MNTIQGGSRTAKVAGYAVMVLVLLIIGLPLYWVVITSLKPDNQVYIQPPVWWPDPITTDSYPQVLADVPFLQYFTNSLAASRASSRSRPASVSRARRRALRRPMR